MEVLLAFKWPLVVVVFLVLFQRSISRVIDRISKVHIETERAKIIAETVEPRIEESKRKAETERKQFEAEKAESLRMINELRAEKAWDTYVLDNFTNIVTTNYDRLIETPPSGQAADALGEILVELADKFPDWKDAIKVSKSGGLNGKR